MSGHRKFAFDLLDGGEIGLEGLGQGLRELVLAMPSGRALSRSAYSATIWFLDLQRIRPMSPHPARA